MSCPVTLPTSSNYNLQESSLNELIKYFANVKDCVTGSNSDSSACQTLSNNASLCTTDMETSMAYLNDQILNLDDTNKQLRAQYAASQKKSNVSGTLFRIYKENAAMAYIQNILLILGIIFLIGSITLLFMKQ
jgi:uncharacterized protein YgiB involved in biofilm formation